MNRNRRFQFHGDRPAGAIRLLSDRVDSRAFDGGRRTAVVNLGREVVFHDHYYGKVEITRKKFQSMIRNFEADTYGQKVYIDVAHDPSGGAAAEITKLYLDGPKLRAEAQFTEYGIDAIKKRGFRYLSMDYTEDYEDPETRKMHGPLLFGAGLTVRPRVKRLDPIELSFDRDGDRMLLSPHIYHLFDEEKHTMNEFLKRLRDRLAARKLSESVISQFEANFEAGAKQLGDNKAALEALCDSLIAAGEQVAVQLAEHKAPGEIKLDFSSLKLPQAAATTLSADDVKRLLAEHAAAGAKKLAEEKATLDARVKVFDDAIAASESIKKLSEDARGKLLGARDMITAAMSEDQVKKLAEHQIKLGGELAAAAELASQGFPIGRSGSAHISVDESNTIKQLQEMVDKRLGVTGRSGARRFESTGGQLSETNKRFAEEALKQYDAQHARRLHEEHKLLSAGEGVSSDVAVPASFERTVIREALYDLVGLNFVNAGTASFNVSMAIPYSYRDTTAAGRGDTRTYEGQGIRRAGMIQTSEIAYPIPQKLAFQVSDELRYLTAARHIDWDAVGENQLNASRIIREDLEQLIFNEILRSNDEYQAVPVVNESLTTNLNGTNNIFPLAQFPVVRPRKVYDLKGAQIGSTANPVTVTYKAGGGAATPILEFDGTGAQAAGTYWAMDYNLGELRLVDQTGAIVTSGASGGGSTLVVSYSYATNVAKFSTDLGGADAGVFWDTFLYRYGLRIAELRDNRYHAPSYGLMSSTVSTTIEQARSFVANFARKGTGLDSEGNLGAIKSIPNFSALAPGLYMADQRVLIGERGTTRMRLMKPWSMEGLENKRDNNGNFTGEKEAYGDQFVVVHTPTQLKRATTSIVLYSSTARVARAAA